MELKLCPVQKDICVSVCLRMRVRASVRACVLAYVCMCVRTCVRVRLSLSLTYVSASFHATTFGHYMASFSLICVQNVQTDISLNATTRLLPSTTGEYGGSLPK